MLEPLLEIHERLHHAAQDIVKDFRRFLFKQNILSLAIGIIIGTATNTVVAAINGDLLMPIVNLFFPDQRWKTYGPVLSTYQDPTGKIIQNKLLVGDLLFNFLQLVMIGFIAYVLTKLLLRTPPVAPPPPAPTTRQCPFCLENVAEHALKCKFCTADLPPLPPPAPAGAAAPAPA